jgi:hypothetical protein
MQVLAPGYETMLTWIFQKTGLSRRRWTESGEKPKHGGGKKSKPGLECPFLLVTLRGFP